MRKRRKSKRRVKKSRPSYRRNPVVSSSDIMAYAAAAAGGVGAFLISDQVNVKFGSVKIPVQTLTLAGLAVLTQVLAGKMRQPALRNASFGIAGVTGLLAVNELTKMFSASKTGILSAALLRAGATTTATAGLLRSVGRTRQYQLPMPQRGIMNAGALSGNNNVMIPMPQ